MPEMKEKTFFMLIQGKEIGLILETLWQFLRLFQHLFFVLGHTPFNFHYL